MGAADEVDIVLLVESRDDLLTKSEGNTSVVLAPALDVLVWVGPKEIAKQSCIRDVSGSHDPLDLLEGAEFGA